MFPAEYSISIPAVWVMSKSSISMETLADGEQQEPVFVPQLSVPGGMSTSVSLHQTFQSSMSEDSSSQTRSKLTYAFCVKASNSPQAAFELF